VSTIVRVKVCGVTNPADALAAVELGADAIGFVFAPSPRRVDVPVATDIVAKLPPLVGKVGVFVNSPISEVRDTMSRCGLDLAQLHGDEDPDYCAALFPRAIKVFTAGNLPPDRDLEAYRVTAFMLDREKGGESSPRDQEQLWQIARKVGHRGPVILAGGLTPENVSRAIEIARPYAVDVASGVEAEPGRKDHARLRAFIETAKRTGMGGEVGAAR
jgi:phosphoribosylanthranilate isomerase